MIEAKALFRIFTYNGVKLPDPDPRMTPEEVKTLSTTINIPNWPRRQSPVRQLPASDWNTACQGYWNKGITPRAATFRSANTN